MNAQERIAQIRERADKATPGPWRIQVVDREYTGGERYSTEHVVTVDDGGVYLADIEANAPTDDGPFIASARADIPFLLDRLQKAEALLRRVNTSDLRDIHVAIDPAIRAFLEGAGE